MSPTILLEDGKPFLALGSPGGATIITSVSQTILGYLDRGLPLVDAVAAPRLSSRNGAPRAPSRRCSTAPSAPGSRHSATGSSNAGEIGAVTAIRSLDGGRFEAAAETVRRGGGSAMVVKPQR